MNLKSFHMSVQGAGHIKHGRECQDASKSFYDERYAYVVVCDGHGGDDYVRSGKGAEFASGIAAEKIKDFLALNDTVSFMKEPDECLKKLEDEIIKDWIVKVRDDYEKNPFTQEEMSFVSERMQRRYSKNNRVEIAYGTTLIAVAMTEEYCFGIQIGDGKCVGIRNEVFRQPIPQNPKCFLNSTTSICDREAINEFRHFYSRKLPVAIFIGSDGVDDCFQNDEQLYALYGAVLHGFATNEFETAKNQLGGYLPHLSAKGSQDDISIAAIFDMDLISSLTVVKNFATKLEQKMQDDNVSRANRDENNLTVDRNTVEPYAHADENLVTASSDGENVYHTVVDANEAEIDGLISSTVKTGGKLSYEKRNEDGELRSDAKSELVMSYAKYEEDSDKCLFAESELLQKNEDKGSGKIFKKNGFIYSG